ncbi:hypothetical protein B0H19DRAFT_226810 [Mycena capillaripes]|nr:hypothetical protein B0H19DRAFT_226810 [Mycena capillaripes]
MSFLKNLSIKLTHKKQTSSSSEPPSSPFKPPFSSEPLSTTISASNVHPQLQSPLCALYPELRNIVFAYVLTEYDDPTHPYSNHEYYYHPGFEFAGRIDTNLLLTCRLVYLETHLAPIALNEHVFWMDPSSGPPRRSILNLGHNMYFRRMSAQQRAAVRRVRFFAQLSWLERRKVQAWVAGLAVRKLTITIRHSDWRYWERGEPLRMQSPQEGWGGWVGSFPQLQELELELESIESKREELEERVRIALKWKFPLKDGASLIHDGQQPIESTWFGTLRQGRGWATLGSARSLDLELLAKKFKFVNADNNKQVACKVEQNTFHTALRFVL